MRSIPNLISKHTIGATLKVEWISDLCSSDYLFQNIFSILNHKIFDSFASNDNEHDCSQIGLQYRTVILAYMIWNLKKHIHSSTFSILFSLCNCL